MTSTSKSKPVDKLPCPDILGYQLWMLNAILNQSINWTETDNTVFLAFYLCYLDSVGFEISKFKTQSNSTNFFKSY